MSDRIVRTLVRFALAAAAALLFLYSPAVLAAPNTATGDIGGVDADLDNSNTINLSSQTLALIKRAFLADGTPLADGTTLPRGTVVKFLLYINNATGFPANDVSVRDVLNAAFAYQSPSIKVDNNVDACVGPCDEAVIFATVDAAGTLSDAVDLLDVASITGATIDFGDQNVANGTLNLAANKVWAALFTVRMQ